MTQANNFETIQLVDDDKWNGHNALDGTSYKLAWGEVNYKLGLGICLHFGSSYPIVEASTNTFCFYPQLPFTGFAVPWWTKVVPLEQFYWIVEAEQWLAMDCHWEETLIVAVGHPKLDFSILCCACKKKKVLTTKNEILICAPSTAPLQPCFIAKKKKTTKSSPLFPTLLPSIRV